MDITDKFVHSILFYNAVLLRHQEEPLPAIMRNVDLQTVQYSFVLVIHGHKLEWLPPLMDALKSKMSDTLKLWNISDTAVKVINDQMALDSHLIVKTT